MAPAGGVAGAFGLSRAAPDPQTAGSREWAELLGGLCGDVANGEDEVEGPGRDPLVFADVVSLRLGGDVGGIA